MCSGQSAAGVDQEHQQQPRIKGTILHSRRVVDGDNRGEIELLRQT